MSESSSQSSADESGEGADDQLIPDEKLPEDLQPAKNPMARDPEEDSGDSDSEGSGDSDGSSAGPTSSDLPDVGQPG